jgi:hypothetical protein
MTEPIEIDGWRCLVRDATSMRIVAGSGGAGTAHFDPRNGSLFSINEQKNHEQTLKQLSERGGLSWSELLAVLECRKWQRITESDAKYGVIALLSEHESKQADKLRARIAELEALTADAEAWRGFCEWQKGHMLVSLLEIEVDAERGAERRVHVTDSVRDSFDISGPTLADCWRQFQEQSK